jgi:hypothetical protein
MSRPVRRLQQVDRYVVFLRAKAPSLTTTRTLPRRAFGGCLRHLADNPLLVEKNHPEITFLNLRQRVCGRFEANGSSIPTLSRIASLPLVLT